MGKIGRRRFALTLAAAPFAPGVSAAARVGGSAGTLSTVFSCGARWTAARSCSALCPSGDDDACPPGQRCYGGTTCEGGSMRDALERQRRLERREMDRLALRREEEYADRFVCGASYEEAAESCAASRPARDSSPSDGTAAAFYCPSGSSGECPAGTRCYAAVSCPRSTHAEEPSLWGEVHPGLPNSFLVTEPILLNSTAADGNNGSVSKDEGGWFASPWRESPSAVLGTATSLLSFGYGSN